MSAWRPLQPKTRARAHALAVRAVVPALSGMASYVEAILDELEAGEVRDAYRVARHHLPPEVLDVTAGVVVACYVACAVDQSVEQRDSDELLSDAGVPSELVPAVIEELTAATSSKRRPRARRSEVPSCAP